MANLRKAALAFCLAATTLSTGLPAQAQNREPDPRDTIGATLERFADDYARDPSATDVTFGIEVDDMRWHVVSKAGEDGRTVTLKPGFPDAPIFYFTAGRETLNLLDQGVWNGLTAMGAASSADKTPLDILFTNGFDRTAEYEAMSRRLIFHFWTKGLPEKVPFGPAHARVVHGAPASALYYDKDFRSAIYFIPPGLGREQAPTIAVPFPRMVIVTKGSAEGEIAGEPFTAREGEMIFAPPGLPVTFWNASGEEGLHFVWLMWGDGA